LEKQRIFIVDDHEVVRIGLRSLLEHHSQFEVVGEAGTAKEAIEKVAQLLPDAVLMDVRLPGPSGIEACEKITKTFPFIKVIILTSYAEDEMLFSAIRAGASGYVLKDIHGDDLVKALEAVGRGEAPLDPGMVAPIFKKMKRIAKQEEASAFSHLSDNEKKVLIHVSEGKTNQKISLELFLGEGTIRNYVSSILFKLHVKNRAEAAAFAVENNLKDYLPKEIPEKGDTPPED